MAFFATLSLDICALLCCGSFPQRAYVSLSLIIIISHVKYMYINFLFSDVKQIRNYNGAARIVVTLVTNETIPKPHAHKLVGKNCNDGSCVVELKPNQNIIT